MSDWLRQRPGIILPPRGVLTSQTTDVSNPVSSLAKRSEFESRTLTYAQIPAWQRDNEYILSGYRHAENSWRACAISIMGYLHNETVNIHSHLWGAVLFVYLLVTFHSTHISRYDAVTWMDTAVFAIFLSSAVFCLVCSAIFHTATCHSEGTSARCNALDYSGIVFLTVGSFYPCIYYGFFCEGHLQTLYLSAITVVGCGAAWVVLNPEYAKSSHRGARTTVFILLGLSAVVPVTHLVTTHGLEEMLVNLGLAWLLLSGALYIIGALIYANRIPEKLAPGMFDLFFASHQIFHVHVLLAALAHYGAILVAFDYRHGPGGTRCARIHSLGRGEA